MRSVSLLKTLHCERSNVSLPPGLFRTKRICDAEIRGAAGPGMRKAAPRHAPMSTPPMTRRELLGLIAGAAAAAGRQPEGSKPAPGRVYRRQYRADATFILFSIPFYTQQNVGQGWAAYETGGSRLSLRFAAGSNPKRARGLNRLGFIEEEVVEREGNVSEAGYFGFMTSSREKSLREARCALERQSDSVPYEAIEGHLKPGNCRNRSARFHCDPKYDWESLESIKSAAREAVSAAGETPVAARAPVPFLYALTRAMGSPERRMQQQFAYGVHPHELRTEKHRDSGTGRRLAESGATHSPEGVMKLDGSIRNLATGKEDRFSLWFEEGSTIPLRFDVRVRSFLRLTFEAGEQA